MQFTFQTLWNTSNVSLPHAHITLSGRSAHPNSNQPDYFATPPKECPSHTATRTNVAKRRARKTRVSASHSRAPIHISVFHTHSLSLSLSKKHTRSHRNRNLLSNGASSYPSQTLVFHLGGRNAGTQSHHHRSFLTVWFFNPSYFVCSHCLLKSIHLICSLWPNRGFD